jgi:tetratricopeptide (TPR) repeat protein
MKIFIIAIAYLACWKPCFSQDARKIYLSAIDSMETGSYSSALELFEETIRIQPENVYAWHNKGIAQGKLDMEIESLKTFKKVIELDSTYKKGWLNLGTTLKRLTDYEGAFIAYKKALSLDTNYQDALYNLAHLYELHNKRDSACYYYKKLQRLGDETVVNRVEKCAKPQNERINSILRLTKYANDNKYGFTEKDPVYVGQGIDGTIANQRAYMNLLRDKMGKKITYKRLASCCHYESKSGGALGLGLGMLDMYEITYLNEKNEEQKSTIYISFDDYEEPKILFGFETIKIP